MKRELMEWEKIFVSHRFEKGLMPKIQMEHIQFKNEYSNNELTKLNLIKHRLKT